MINLIQCELKKLKRSKMVYISFAAAVFSPLMMFLIEYHTKFVQGKEADFLRFGTQTNSIISLLLGTLLYGLITAHLFSMEFEENTLKSLFTVPVNRVKLLCAKFTVVGIWIAALTLFTFVLVLSLSRIFGFENFSGENMVKVLKLLFYTALLLYPLQFFIAVVTLFFKGLFPPITFTIAVQITGFVLMRSKYLAIFPWTIPARLTTTKFSIPDYSPELSVCIFISSCTLALIVAAVRFKKIEI